MSLRFRPEYTNKGRIKAVSASHLRNYGFGGRFKKQEVFRNNRGDGFSCSETHNKTMTTAFLVPRSLLLCMMILAQGCPDRKITQSSPRPADETSVVVHRVRIEGEIISLPRLDWLGYELLSDFPDLRSHFDSQSNEMQLLAAPSDAEKVIARRKELAATGPRWLKTLPLDGLDATATLTDLKTQFPGVRLTVAVKETKVIVLANRDQLAKIEARVDWLKEKAVSK